MRKAKKEKKNLFDQIALHAAIFVIAMSAFIFGRIIPVLFIYFSHLDKIIPDIVINIFFWIWSVFLIVLPLLYIYRRKNLWPFAINLIIAFIFSWGLWGPVD